MPAVRSDGLRETGPTSAGEPDLGGKWALSGLRGLGHSLHLVKVRPFAYEFKEFFLGGESGSGRAFFDVDGDGRLLVSGVNTLAGAFSGTLDLVDGARWNDRGTKDTDAVWSCEVRPPFPLSTA